MRDTSSWYGGLADELNAGGGLPPGRLAARDFFTLELGLYFLATSFPGEPAGALWPLLSGYIAAGPPQLQPVIRRVRHRMGDMARRGYWRYCLDHYRRLPAGVRGFDRTDDPSRPVSDRTVFKPREPGPAVCAERFTVYQQALDDPVPYAGEPVHPPAEPGKAYTFQRRDGSIERVQIPAWIEVLPPPPVLAPRTQRRRERWRISFTGNLQPAAEQIDKALQGKPEVTNRDFTTRLKKIIFCAVNQETGSLDENPGWFEIDGVEHIVGLMNSGKTTLADLITYDRVGHGFHVTLVLGSVTDVYAKVSFLRQLGIDAVPLVGKNTRTEHAARYWRSTLTSSPAVFPAAGDPAADFVTTACLLEPFREASQAEWSPLTPGDFPCRAALRPADGRRRLHDCPLLAICPYQETERRIANAQVWVTTAPGLTVSRAHPSAAQMRWLEACQHHSDLIIVDEADVVQQNLDERFLQYETLVAPGEGWTDRTTISKVGGFDQGGRRQLRDRNVRLFNDYDRAHQLAVDRLYELLLDNEGLREFIGSAPFTGYSLLLQVARAMHGLPLRRMDDDAAAEDAAEDFFRQHLERLADDPFAPPSPGLADAVGAVTAEFTDPQRIEETVAAWLRANAPRGRPHVEGNLGLLVLLFQAGYWASRIATSFFEMSTLYPAAADKVPLEDEDSFWRQQPPRDYQALVPEAPMGNLLALQWQPSRQGDTGTLRVLWVRGVGRWLLHHLHDLLEPEGIQGPHVILTSATSWAPGSSFYHIPVTPTAVLREPAEDRQALQASNMKFRPMLRADGTPVAVSGRQGPARKDALRELAAGICLPRPGAQHSLLEQVRSGLDEDRRQVLFVVLSGADAELVAEHINTKTPYTARNVTPDADDPGQYGLHRRMITQFPQLGDDILVAAEMAIQRGYNILNASKTAAIGAVFYLTRPHPPPTDPKFPLSLINQRAMDRLLSPVENPAPVHEAARELAARARAGWFGLMSKPVYFRRLNDDTERPVFVANALVPMGQTIGRSIRGNQPTTVILCDAAFAPRHANPRDTARDTIRTSLIVAADRHLGRLLAAPPADAPAARHRDHKIAEAVWGLTAHLFHTIDMGH